MTDEADSTPDTGASGDDARPRVPDAHEGGWLLWASWVGTAALVLAAVPATIAPDRLAGPYVVVSMVMFFAGILAFFAAYVRAVGRSRAESIGVVGVFFLAGAAPGRVRWHLMGSFAVEVAVGVAAASVRIYTPTAFGILAPMYGLGVAGMWGARYGVFEPREASSERR